MDMLRMADFFGTPFTQQIDQKQALYKSVFGGVVTLTIFSASLAYSIWVIYLWQTNQLSPKISNSLNVSDFKLLDLNYDVVKLYFWKYDQSLIDPFEERILLPIVMYTENFSFTSPYLINKSSESTNYGNYYYSPKMSLSFSNMSGVLYTTSEMYVQIVKCSEIYLKEGEKCAPQELIDQFFQQALNVIVLQLNYKQLNSKDGSVQYSVQEFYIQIEPQNCYTLNTFLQSNLYQVQDSFIFGDPKHSEYINGALIQPQTNSVQYCQLAYSAEVYSLIYIVMKGNQTKTIFDYPKASDLLANIGSIVSVLFMLKYFIIFLNQHFVNEKVIKDLISIYYPEFNLLKIKKNWRKKIIDVQINNKNIDVTEFMKFYKHTREQMKMKLCYLNLLYEISRLYFLIRSEKNREEIKKCHYVGIKIDLFNNDSAFKSYSSNRPSRSLQILNEEDIGILSLQERTKEFSETKIPDEMGSARIINFYDINKIL